MMVKDSKELFVMLLSNVRQGAENAATIYQMMSQAAEHPDIKEALEARAFVSNKALSTIDECFKIIGQSPMKATGRLHDVFVEEFRKDLAEIQSPEARRLYILHKAHQLNHIRMGEYIVLIEAADSTGHYGVGLLLATVLADKMTFVERTRRLIRSVIEDKIASRQTM